MQSRFWRKIWRGFVKKKKGMTLIELAIVLVVVGILVGTVTPFFKVSIDSYFTVRTQKDLLQAARIGLNRMMSELRQLEGSLDITYGSSTRIDFDYSILGENITYDFYNGQVIREGQKLIGNVQNFIIRYYTPDGTEKSTPFGWDSDVWRIQIEMEVGTEGKSLQIRGQSSPRSFHYQ